MSEMGSATRPLTELDSLVITYCAKHLESETEGNEAWLNFLKWVEPLLADKPKGSRTRPKGRKRGVSPRRRTGPVRRYQRFKRVQQAISRDKSRTYRELLSGNFKYMGEGDENEPPIGEIQRVFSDRLESAPADPLPELVNPPEEESNAAVYGPFSETEIHSLLAQTDVKSAPGPCRWLTFSALRKLGYWRLALILNSWWASGKVPLSAKECRTILIHKKGPRTEVGNWRPITIASTLLRLYTKGWDMRLRRMVTINERQKAFVPVDGCFENVRILQRAIKRSRKARHNLSVVFLDLAKAFDTVRHDSIARALRRFAVPNEVIQAILNTYEGAATTISNSTESTRPIGILNGVKQGDPLSPLLFNLVMDELITEVDSLDVGIDVGGTKVGILAFANDLVLLTQNPGDMQVLLNRATKFFDDHGLKVNAAKCQSLLAEAVSGKQNHKVITEVHRWWKGEPLPCLTFDSLARYLGVEFNPRGEIVLPEERWTSMFENIRKAPLRPHQRAEIIKTWLVPKLTYQLRVSDIPMSKVARINRSVKRLFKELLHLPESTPDCWLHLPTGGGLPNLCDLVLKSWLGTSLRMTGSTDLVTQEVGRMELTRVEDNLRWSGLGHLGGPRQLSSECQRGRMRALEQIHNGKALACMAASEVARPYLWDGTLRGENMVYGLKILSSTLPTRINLSKGRPAANKRCRRCRKTAETDLHVLNECAHNRKAMCKRHDNLVEIVVKNLRRRGFLVKVEKCYQLGLERFRPDITAKKGGKAFLIDVTVPYERCPEVFGKRASDKRTKYACLTSTPLQGLGDTSSTEVIPIVVGSAGTIPRSTLDYLSRLGIRDCAKTLGASALAGSVKVWRIHVSP